MHVGLKESDPEVAKIMVRQCLIQYHLKVALLIGVFL